jgi:hypothetical protein
MYLLARRWAVLAVKTVKPPTVGREGAVTITQPGGASQCAELFVTQRRPGRLGGGAPVCGRVFSGRPETDVGLGRMWAVWNATWNPAVPAANQQPTTNVPWTGSNPAISDLRSLTHTRAGDESTSHFSTSPLVNRT